MRVWFRLLLSVLFSSLLLTGSLLPYQGHAKVETPTSKEQKKKDTTPQESVYAAVTITVIYQAPEADLFYLPTATNFSSIADISVKLNTNETAAVARQIFLKTLLTDIISPQAP